ncbi:MAG: MFS transporter [Actinomyces sp.]|uniref:MFS transporter n=1 Tax=Actinomyces sp. TaxID=29317 RepID=UPI0026DAD130|nr:MFS transporter [Actinomyces sp.]MDO4242998.1 MFS transporter [Actinomyces sp.]
MSAGRAAREDGEERSGSAAGSGRGARWSVPVLAVGIVLVALILRPGATSTGPVLEEIRSGLGLGSTGAALLASLPGACFAVAGAVAARLGHRMGAAGGLVIGGVLAGAGMTARAVTGSGSWFLALSALALVGAGLGNVLLPMAIKERFPTNPGAWTAVYVTVLSVGAVLPQLLAPTVIEAGGSWRTTLAVWGPVGILAAVPWLVLALVRRRAALLAGPRARRRPAEDRDRTPSPPEGGAARTIGLREIARSPRARAMALFFGLQSMQAYVIFGWFAQILRDAGLGLATASHLLAAFSAWGLLGGLIIPALVARSRHLRAWVVLFAGLLVLGFGGLLLAPRTVSWLWPCALGISGFCFQVALVLVTARTRDYRVTAALSGFTQAIGYTLASAGPFVVGWVHALSGGWTVPLVLLIASAVPMGWAGWHACAPGMVDDELPAR